jgi:hypothetical protein
VAQGWDRVSDDEFYAAEERIISMREAVLGDENNKDARLVREFTEPFESYKKVYKQLRQMTRLVDPGRTTDRA